MADNKQTKRDEEREAMAKKLDEDLDAYMLELAAKSEEKRKRSAADGGDKKEFDFERWCREIDQHPAFSSSTAKSASESCSSQEQIQESEIIEALEAMKHSDPVSEAEYFREQGNAHFKAKKYREAIDAYTEGLKQRCSDGQLQSVLYSNRAIANRALKNTRSALKDCVFARKFNARNWKARLIGAQCLFELGKAGECREWIALEELLEESEAKGRERNDSASSTENDDNKGKIPPPETISALRQLDARAKQLYAEKLRDARLAEVKRRKARAKSERLFSELQKRKLLLRPQLTTPEALLFEGEEGVGNGGTMAVDIAGNTVSVYFDEETGALCWPLCVQFPEVGRVDLVTDCAETSSFRALLGDLFAQRGDWDTENAFSPENVRLFVEIDDLDAERFRKRSNFDPSATTKNFVREVQWDDQLGAVLAAQTPKVPIRNGLPLVQCYTKRHLAGRAKRVDSDSSNNNIFHF